MLLQGWRKSVRVLKSVVFRRRKLCLPAKCRILSTHRIEKEDGRKICERRI
ncbi:Uncharacterized protein APZ42_000051 [Daphnia magna]|uniref:Uncharacterized protein n=1 Tax=Daphnia magna TaxID=35525 RepID=A0A162CA56_9CRUS|nr:Uncharacterized protein APZ42_000051 [Daphnia magna]